MSSGGIRGTKLWRQSLVGMMLLTSSSSSAFASDQSLLRGRTLAFACVACHGPEGRSTGAIPSLHAIPVETMGESLRAFRSGERQGTVMNRVAQGLNDTDIETVARYFSTRGRR